MKKQKIYPLHFIRFLRLAIWLLLIVCSLYAIIYVIIENRYDIVGCLGLIFGLIIFFISIITIILELKRGVRFGEKSIFVSADPATLFVKKIQHEINLDYNEIEKVYLISSKRDSLGRKVANVFVEMPYIVFVCSDGKEKAINVYYYSKTQVIKILDEVILRATGLGKTLNYSAGETLLKEFLDSYKGIK